MATAFTDTEQELIQQALKEEARTCALSFGVRKTTVEQLANAAGISKGAFYKFYDSKELLFFEILEDFHAELYNVAAKVLAEQAEHSDPERAAQAILAVCHLSDELGIMRFVEQDAAYLLRKIPTEVQEKHYHSDAVHIAQLLTEAGLTPRGGMALAAAAVRGLFLTVSHKGEIGEAYDEVLELLVRGACQQLFSQA